MTPSSSEILERLRLTHGKDINLTLRSGYLDLLARLGSPHLNLPPTILVAGTNGKGSTCAFLRAMIEATGRKVHVYTSPHLIRFHERIRIAGALISEEELVSLLLEIEREAEPGAVSLFEALTAAAFAAFARQEADVALLEVGLGGRLDATNVAPRLLASVITRLSFDHREFLGESMAEIALEKAGVFRPRAPCFLAPQPSSEAMLALREKATDQNVPLVVGGEDWRIEAVDGEHFRFLNSTRKIERIPRPALLGTHQLWNAGLAMATSAALPFEIQDEAIKTAMKTVHWPGRLQQINDPSLPKGWELWLDGGHNDSAGEVLAAQLQRWHRQDGKPIDLIYGMLTTKTPDEFLGPMLPFLRHIRTVYVEGERPGFAPEVLASKVRACGHQNVEPAPSPEAALQALLAYTDQAPARILVCGSLYLVGDVLKKQRSGK